MNSRDQILKKLRAAQQPFTDVPPITQRRHMVPIMDASPEALKMRFITESEKLSAKVWEVENAGEGIQTLLDLVGDDKTVMSWDYAHIPLPGLQEAMGKTGIKFAKMRDARAHVGITGVDAALAATGSLLLCSGVGKPRQASLLPMTHIAVITTNQIVPDLETWFQIQREKGLEHFRRISNPVIISGPSRTADIAMELIMGVHGPGEVHVILLRDKS